MAFLDVTTETLPIGLLPQIAHGGGRLDSARRLPHRAATPRPWRSCRCRSRSGRGRWTAAACCSRSSPSTSSRCSGRRPRRTTTCSLRRADRHRALAGALLGDRRADGGLAVRPRAPFPCRLARLRRQLAADHRGHADRHLAGPARRVEALSFVVLAGSIGLWRTSAPWRSSCRTSSTTSLTRRQGSEPDGPALRRARARHGGRDGGVLHDEHVHRAVPDEGHRGSLFAARSASCCWPVGLAGVLGRDGR